MLIFAQLSGHQASDDEDSRLTKMAAIESGRYNLCTLSDCQSSLPHSAYVSLTREAFTLIQGLHVPCRSNMQARRNTPELVWSGSPSQSFISSHLISSQSTSLSASIAPSTPEKSGLCGAVPAMTATRQDSTASKLLGPQEVGPWAGGITMHYSDTLSCVMCLT